MECNLQCINYENYNGKIIQGADRTCRVMKFIKINMNYVAQNCQKSQKNFLVINRIIIKGKFIIYNVKYIIFNIMLHTNCKTNTLSL